MEKEQVKKIQRNNPQQRLFNHILKQSHTNETTNYPLYSTLPRITKIRNKIDALIIQPLLNNTFACKNVICRGPTGTGKSFVIESICNEYKLKLLTCKCTELADTLQKARVIKKCIVMIYDIEKVEDFDVTYNIIETLKNNKDVCVIAEVNEEIDKRYRKYGCFEEEIVFDIPDNDEKCEILSFLYKKYIDIPSNINFTEIAKSIPAYTPSDISILTRRVKLRIIDNICNDQTYYEVLKESNIRKTDVTFDDIGGMRSVKDELYKYIVAPITNAETYKKFGIKTSAGILLHGPPGCGKTMLAKAVSNVACCNFISVKGPEIINKYVGNTEKALREIFDKAHNLQPCVIFFDEIDSLCCKRGNNDFNDRVVNQFLTLLDGIETRRNVFVLGATNRKDRIDEAFLRSGRFDRCIEIALPDRDEKEKIFEKYTKDKKCEVFDFEELDTTDFSGADIYGMVQQAFIEFITHNIENTDGVIEKSYFINAANNIQKERSK